MKGVGLSPVVCYEMALSQPQVDLGSRIEYLFSKLLSSVKSSRLLEGATTTLNEFHPSVEFKP